MCWLQKVGNGMQHLSRLGCASPRAGAGLVGVGWSLGLWDPNAGALPPTGFPRLPAIPGFQCEPGGGGEAADGVLRGGEAGGKGSQGCLIPSPTSTCPLHIQHGAGGSEDGTIPSMPGGIYVSISLMTPGTKLGGGCFREERSQHALWGPFPYDLGQEGCFPTALPKPC